jgi:iron complex transport system substrate-binding protein
MDPVMVAGHWMPELVEIAGGRYDLVDPGERSTPWEWDEIRAYDPEVAVIAPCGFGLDQTRENIADLTARDGWPTLSAVENDRVTVLDGHHYVNRPGQRLVETAEFLAGILHPDAFERPPSDVAAPLSQTVP